jgi:hypothetical protein
MRKNAEQPQLNQRIMVQGRGWGVLVAMGDKSRDAKHLDRSTDKNQSVVTGVMSLGDIQLTLVKTTVGRMLMNAEGTARAANQVADILIDVPSGACGGDGRGMPPVSCVAQRLFQDSIRAPPFQNKKTLVRV